MKEVFFIGGLVGMAVPVYVLLGQQLLTGTNGAIVLPGTDGLTNWEVWTGILGFIFVVLSVFV